MKKLIAVAIIVAGFLPQHLLAQETEAIRQVLQDNYTVLSIYQKGSFARAVVREPDGKEIKIYLKKDQAGWWKIFPEKDAPADVFKETEKQDEKEIKVLQENDRRTEDRRRRDQDIADDIEGDRD